MLRSRKNQILLSFSFWPQLEPREGPNIYEMRSYTLKVGTNTDELLYSYFMPVCSIVKTITPRCRRRPDSLLHEAEGRVQLCIRSSRVPRGNSLTILQTDMK